MAARYTLRYGILDPEGRVVRWVFDPPAGGIYRYVTVKTPRPRPEKIDLSQFEPALF
jgi:hypothetical protein